MPRLGSSIDKDLQIKTLQKQETSLYLAAGARPARLLREVAAAPNDDPSSLSFFSQRSDN